jgi:exosortase/archaeosortase family protein
LWAAAGLVIVHASAMRSAEAWLAARLAGFYIPGHAESAGAVFFAGLGTQARVGLEITPECTVVILVVPMLVVVGIISLFGQFSLRGVLAGIAAGLAVDIVVNQVRIGLIAWGASRYGSGGYELTHKLIGSLIAMLGFTVAFVLMIRIMTRHPRARRPR